MRCVNRIQILDDSKAKMLGWHSKLLRIGHSLAFTVKSEIVLGLGLQRGCKIFSYVAKDQLGRYLIVSYPQKQEVADE